MITGILTAISREELVAIGWALLHFCWQGAAIALLFAAADSLIARIASRTSAGIRYAVALGALALMPLVFLATLTWEMQTAPSPHPPAYRLAAQPIELADHLFGLTPADLGIVNGNFANASSSSVKQPRWTRLKSDAEQILPWVDTVWALGILLLAVRALGGWWQLEQIKARAQSAVPPELQVAFHRIARQIGVSRTIVLSVSEEVISPMVMGVWRATVILPVSSLMRLSPAELEAVLAHELGHIRRWDYLCNLMQAAVESILFFHPAVWWISRTVRERRELCCDTIAVACCADPLVYAQALLRMEEQKILNLQPAFAMQFHGTKGSLLRRVNRILGEGESMENRMTNGVRVAVAAFVLSGLFFGPSMSAVMAAPIAQATSPVASTPSATTTQARATAHANANTKDQPRVTLKTSNVTTNADVHTVVVTSVNSNADVAVLSQSEEKSATATNHSSSGSSYIEGMRDAGYPLDLGNDFNTLISLKSLGVTPDYAKAMGALGFGKPTVQQLISLRSLGVTPDYISELKASGIAPRDFNQVESERALGVTPAYAIEMKQAGFSNLDAQGLISLRAQGVTGEYTKWLKSQFPSMTLEELQRAAVFHLDDKFVTQARSHGFDGKDIDKLLRLKMSGLLDD